METERLIIPEIKKLSKDTTWRVRLATIDFIPLLVSSVSKKCFEEEVEPLLKQFLEDTVHSIRIDAIQCLIKLKDQYFNQQWLEKVINERLEEFHKHPKFTIRIHSLFCIN